ncbi:hypothetical protein EOL70_25385 [Leucothrix sargassi]|nr:hypothetical protein EOL70_25385 [Leucothrix sargassi]
MVNLSAYAQTTYYTTTGIPESSTLTLRAWPSHASKPLANIPHNSTSIMPTGKNILLNEDNWLQVAFENQVGWVEDAYLAKVDTPATQTPTAPIAEAPAHQAPVFAMPDIEPTETTPVQPVAYTTPSYESQNIETTQQQQEIPWSASADSIYADPNAPATAHIPQPAEVITTHHSVVVIPPTVEDIDLRAVDVDHSRYSSVDSSFSLQYDQ